MVARLPSCRRPPPAGPGRGTARCHQRCRLAPHGRFGARVLRHVGRRSSGLVGAEQRAQPPRHVGRPRPRAGAIAHGDSPAERQQLAAGRSHRADLAVQRPDRRAIGTPVPSFGAGHGGARLLLRSRLRRHLVRPRREDHARRRRPARCARGVRAGPSKLGRGGSSQGRDRSERHRARASPAPQLHTARRGRGGHGGRHAGGVDDRCRRRTRAGGQTGERQPSDAAAFRHCGRPPRRSGLATQRRPRRRAARRFRGPGAKGLERLHPASRPGPVRRRRLELFGHVPPDRRPGTFARHVGRQ